MNLRILLIGCWMAAGLIAGGDWAPITPDIWAIKEGPKGAVVLEERLRFLPREMETSYRVRIFAEAGRGAAALPDIPTEAFGIKGRTVYPDGREITFDNRKDFAERKLEVGNIERSRVHLMPPGVTADCVVEVQWRERSDGYANALPRRLTNGLYGQWRLGNAFPTRLSILEINENMPLASTLTSGGRWQAEAKTVKGYRVFTYRDLPSVEAPPYSLAVTNGLPKLEIFWQPDALIRAFSEGKDAYWREAFDKIYRPDYEDSIDTGRPFKKVAAELIQGLPITPHARAIELLARLEARIKNISHPTAEESAAMPKNFWRDYSYKRLDKIADTGLASSRGMHLMFYWLLKEAEIQPLIAKVVDREKDIFNFNHLNVWQFHHDLLGVEELGKATLWIDPGNRYATPGVVHPDYQGVSMLVFEKRDNKTWKPSRDTLAPATPATNRRAYTYSLTLEEDSDQFALKAEFGGYPEYSERYRYLPLAPMEQTRTLKDRFESNQKNYTISKAIVLNATNPAERVSWEVTGVMERESGRRREVVPFPGMPWPLWVPDKLDETRTESIVLPYLSTQTAVSSFEVPKGYRFDPHPALQHQNVVGTVLWTTEFDPATRKVTVHLETTIISLVLGPNHYQAFKEFLGWIQESCRRTIILDRDA